MARRKLYGAALAAHQRKVARTKRSRKRRRAKPQRRRSRRRNRTMAKRKRRSRRRRGSNYGTTRLRVFGAGVGYGYVTRKMMTEDTRSKLPGQDSIGFDGVMAIILHYGAKHFRSKWLDAAATAAAGHCGVVLGKNDLNMDEAKAALSGGGDAILGAMDAE